jgi:2-polyprenyl-6-methoxyphenol hydroxylase-like FAD-dependent oxidoreductase
VVSQFPLSPVGKILKRQLREMIAARIEDGKGGRRHMKIRIIGGGPAGLYFASLMKREDPAHDVVVFERGSRDATWGFGVVFSDRALEFLRADDEADVPVAHAADGDLAQPHHRAQRHAACPSPATALPPSGAWNCLSRLYAQAESLGVRIEFDSEP